MPTAMETTSHNTGDQDRTNKQQDFAALGIWKTRYRKPAWTSTSGEGSSSAPGRPPWRGPWKTAFSPWTRNNALARYADYFSPAQQDLDGNGAQTNLVQAAVIRDVTRGVVPQRQRVNGAVPCNLMKSEQLVWVIQGVDYLETVVRRERCGTSHGVSIRVARGLYYSPRQFRSRPIEWEETVHADTGMLGLTTKHIHFAGSRKRSRVRYDRIVASGPYEDGSGTMRDARTAKPQTFRAKGGWSACNLAVNLAQLQG